MMIDESQRSGEPDVATRYNLELSRVLAKWLRAQKALQLRSGLHTT